MGTGYTWVTYPSKGALLGCTIVCDIVSWAIANPYSDDFDVQQWECNFTNMRQ